MRFFFPLCITLLLISGCAQVENFGHQVESVGRFVKYNVQGEHYLLTKNYKRGSEVFMEALKGTPEDSQCYYYLGRYQLALRKKKDALKSLKNVRIYPKWVYSMGCSEVR